MSEMVQACASSRDRERLFFILAFCDANLEFGMVKILPIVEYLEVEQVKSRRGKSEEIFSTKNESNIDRKYYVGVKEALTNARGIYIFYDSRGRAIYAGKAIDQNLWKEMNLVYNRPRGDLQTITLASHPVNNISYKSYLEKENVIRKQEVLIHHIATYVSAYSISPTEMISPLEALIIRAFANDLLNKKMEKF